MHLSQTATLVAIGLLFTCALSSGEDRSASSSQRYTIHVPKEVKFGLAEPSTVSKPAALSAKEDAESFVFMAETTSGMTIQFETQTEPARKQPLQLTVGGRQQGSWSAQVVADAEESPHELVAEGTSVQASTLGAGWATLTIGTISTDATAGDSMTTIVVTIVAH